MLRKKYKCYGEQHVKYQNGLMPSPRKGTLNEQLKYWKGQKVYLSEVASCVT